MRLLPALVASAALFASNCAFAVGPTEQVATTPSKFATYSAVLTGLVPAASATDFFLLQGSATKTVILRKLTCTGTSTAAGSLAVTLVQRSTANTGGTAVAATEVPLDTNDPTATAVVQGYTANPTVGTLIAAIDSGVLGTVAAASAGSNGVSFSYTPDDVRKAPAIHGVAQEIAINAGGQSFTSGASLTCDVIWTEN